jgi:hypothetical protein
MRGHSGHRIVSAEGICESATREYLSILMKLNEIGTTFGADPGAMAEAAVR